MPLHTTIYARSPQGCAGKVILVRHHEKSIRKQHVLAHPELQHTLTEQAVVKRTAREVNDLSVADSGAQPIQDKYNFYPVIYFQSSTPAAPRNTVRSEYALLARAGAPLNPLKLAAMLTLMEAAFFFSGWLAWNVDVWESFAVTLSLTEYFGFGEDRHKVTTAITLTLLLRSLGAVAVRTLFGVGMGGIWGMATAIALENMLAAPRGLFSGILQQGYAAGYLLAASVSISYVNRSNNFRMLGLQWAVGPLTVVALL
ncbi:hypothetical protein CF328_g5147 [Tilletia controversa]|nr:hypothetical protein CF328_g5147 [Tilletia controversa]